MNQAFSKIWLVVILAVLIAGGILAWQYFGAPKEEVKAPEEGELSQCQLGLHSWDIEELKKKG